VRMKRRIGPGAARLLLVIGLLVLWEAVAHLFGDPLFFSAPSQMAAALVGFLNEPKVLDAIDTTLWELVVAFALSVAVGLPLGLILGLRRFAFGSFFPLVLLAYATPQATILPLVV